jgi:hypothetical protein
MKKEGKSESAVAQAGNRHSVKFAEADAFPTRRAAKLNPHQTNSNSKATHPNKNKKLPNEPIFNFVQTPHYQRETKNPRQPSAENEPILTRHSTERLHLFTHAQVVENQRQFNRIAPNCGNQGFAAQTFNVAHSFNSFNDSTI